MDEVGEHERHDHQQVRNALVNRCSCECNAHARNRSELEGEKSRRRGLRNVMKGWLTVAGGRRRGGLRGDDGRHDDGEDQGRRNHETRQSPCHGGWRREDAEQSLWPKDSYLSACTHMPFSPL